MTLIEECSMITDRLQDDGSLYVNNTCTRGDKSTFIEGQAVAADEAYGKAGVLRVRFPVQPSLACEGPNYIVQSALGLLLDSRAKLTREQSTQARLPLCSHITLRTSSSSARSSNCPKMS